MTTTETTQSAPAAKSAKKAPRVNWHEKFEELEAVHKEMVTDRDELLLAVETMHDSYHDGAYRHCPHAVCDAANIIEYAKD